MKNDDDLPVLTQVLRLRSGPLSRPSPATSGTSLPDQLVIGNEPHPIVEPNAADVVAVGGPPAADAADVVAVEGPPADAADVVAGEGPPADAADVVAVGGPPADAMGGPPSPVAADAVAPTDPATFARRVREAVLADLVARIDTELDARIAQAIHIEVETAVAQLQDKLRVHLTQSLRDVVARAVDDEIGRSTEASRPRDA